MTASRPPARAAIAPPHPKDGPFYSYTEKKPLSDICAEDSQRSLSPKCLRRELFVDPAGQPD